MSRFSVALAFPLLVSAVAAQAQIGPSVPAPGIVADRSARPDFRMPAGLRDVSPAPRSGLIAALPVADNLHLGVGRFAVRGHGGRHANLEPERRAADGRARGRAIAAVGFSFTF